jgi:hypothetical protein
VIGVFDAHDVVLGEIGARLDLDDFERDLPGVFETVARSGGDMR